MSILIRISTPQHGAVGKDKKNSTKSSEIRRSTYSRPKTALLLLTILLFMPTIMAAPLVTGSGPSVITVCDPSPITYTLTITNPAGVSANNPVLSVTIPSGFYYAGSTSITYPDSTNPRITSNQNPTGTNVLVWNLGTLIQSQRSVVVNEVYPNPTSGGSKQVELFNSGSSTVDLNGWSLRNSAGILLTFSTSTPIASGGFLLVPTPGLIINSDTVMLYDPSNVKRDTITYSSGSSNQGKSYASQPDGARGTASFAWRTPPTLGASNGGTRGDLNVGETITVSFTLKAGCSAVDGQNLKADLAYTGGTASFTTPSTFLVNRGLMKVLKTPTVVSASVGDSADFNITVENIGTGTAYNVVMTNGLGSGLSMQTMTPNANSSSPPNYTWNLGTISAGEKKTVAVKEKIIKCVDIFDEARANWGCDNSYCQQNYAKASVKILLRSPRFDFTLPTSLAIPYCGKSLASIPYSNTGLGIARDVHFHVLGLVPQYEIANVTGGSYNSSSAILEIGDVPASTSGTIAFDLVMKHGACDAPASGVLAFEPNYHDECDKEWAPPTKYFTFSLDSSTRPSIAVTKDGPDSLYLDQTAAYSISALYTKGNCAADNVTVDIVDTYPVGFELISGAGGIVNLTAHTITWEDVTLDDGIAWSPDGSVVMKASSNPCDCGRSFTNSVNTSTLSDCCGCPLSGSAGKTILVECRGGFSSDKSASPASQENCRQISYTTTYRFNSTVGLTWAAMNFTEQGNNDQTFPGGSKTGTAQFTIIGPTGTALGTVTHTITLGAPTTLDFLDESWLTDGVRLEINCSLSQPNTGSFVDWSDLNINGQPSACTQDKSYHEGVSVSVSQSDFSIDMVYPQKMDSCGRYNFTINLHQNGIWPGNRMNVSYDDTNFRYTGNATISGIKSSGVAISSFEPTRSGNTLTWSLGDEVSCDSGTGTIVFAVEKTCSQERPIRADLSYRDNCQNQRSGSFSGAPILLDKGRIILKKTPEVLFATQKEVTWRIYVTNSGSGTAYNVQLVDTLDSGLSYIPGTSTLDGSPREPLQSSQILTWNLPDMAPNAGYIVEFQARLVGCQNLNNNAAVRWGCGGELCQELTDSSKVELVSTTLQAVKHSMDKVDTCGELANASLWVRNSGDAYAYNITISETLPLGMVLDSYTLTSSPAGFAPTSTSFSGNSLKWYFNQSGGMAPGTQVNIEFKVHVADACTFGTGGTARARAAFQQPCSSTSLSAESPITVSRFAPNVAITKTPATTYADSGQEITWTIKLTSNGDYTAKQVVLWDILPANAQYVSSTPAKNSGTGTAIDPLVWNIGSMARSATATTIIVKARVTGCTSNTLNNATVFWGCCPTSRQKSTATATLVTVPTIAITQPLTLASCGGAYRITFADNGANATTSQISNVHPIGFVYVNNSATITSNKAGRTFPNTEPSYNQATRTLTWSAANVDRILQGETITINFNLVNCPSCCSGVTTSNNAVTYYYLDSCGYSRSATNSKANTPTRPILTVTKTPKVQKAGGSVSWTLSVSNTGTAAASNVTVTDVLGDCYTSIGPGGGVLTANTPQLGWNTIKWSGQSIPMGTNTWQKTVTAVANNLNGDTSNNVLVEGFCASGCVYSRANDSASSFLVDVNKGQDVDAIVGQEIVFPINVSFHGFTLYASPQIVETIPAGLQYLNWSCLTDSCTACLACGGSPAVTTDGSGNTIVTWTQSSFNGPRNLTLTVKTRVKNTLANRQGTTMTNKVDVRFKSQGLDQQADDTAQINVLALPTLGDFVWEDLNKNGIQDAGEPGIANVTVILKNSSATLTTTTNASGLYQFSDLFTGSYNLTFLLPNGYSFTLQDQGSDNIKDSDVNSVTGQTIQISLNASQRDFTWDAGMYRLASLGDYVWEDLNRNGVQDAGEPGIAEVTVTLKNETATLTTTTDAVGLYLFDNLLPGSYNLTFLLPTGYSFTLLDQGADNGKDSDADVTSGKTTPITLASGQNDPTWDAGLIRPASLGDFVWEDLNRNGVQDAGEPGIADVTVTLKNETATLTTTTDANGLYMFDNLLPGSYNLTFLLPTGCSFTLQDQGADNSKDSDADIASGKTTTITLASGQHDPTWDAGVIRPASLGDFVWEDLNRNGVQDAGEPGIADVTVTLKNETATLTTTTDAVGLYLFDNLVPGSYNLTFLLPTGYSFTLQDQGADNSKDSDADVASGKTTTITLASGQNDPTWDAGVIRPASLGDFVWEDLNRNGVQDAGEPGIADVTVTLKNATTTLTTTTVANGLYLFDNLLPGSYNLTFLLPNGYSFTLQDQGADNGKDSDVNTATGKTTTITLASGQNDPTWDAGMYKLASLGDYVWEDLNRNGVQDAGEPGIADVTVTLKNETATLTTTTDADGLYLFDNLVPGSYNLTFLLPTGYSFTLRDQGADNSKDSDADVASGKTTTITLASGQHDPTWDAGLIRPASLGDFVWEDLNRNGVQDAGEPGIAEVTVILKNATTTLTTTTVANGLYLFDNLVPGSYNLTFLLPTGYSFTLQNQGADNSKDSDVNTATGKTTTITLASGQNDPTWDAGMYKLASLGDYVWEDLNRNGVQDAGEPGIADVTVTLKNETATLTTTTDAGGLYLFDNLVPGSYNLTFLLPTGYSFTLQDQGADNSKDSDVNTATGKTTTITLASGQHDPTWDAGVIRPASLGDFVWEDLNRNGVQDAGEPGIADVTVTLKNETATLTTTTDAVGLYLFDNLLPGSYNLTFLLPTSYSFTLQDQGGDNSKDNDADVASGKTTTITLASGQHDPTWDAGLIRPASLGDFVWEDLNRNGVQDAGEPGIADVTVTLKNATTTLTTTTDANGLYLFDKLVPGSYNLTFLLPNGYSFTLQNQGADNSKDSDADVASGKTTTITLASGQHDPTWDAGLIRPASLGDFVWEDLNRNGVQDAGEPGIADVTVTLKNETATLTTTTDAVGLYLFDNLVPGSYNLTFLLPTGYSFTLQDQGADNGKDSDADAASGKTTTITLASGQHDPTWDAGLIRPASLGDFVWEDLNRNGVQDAGEPGIAEVTVILKNATTTLTTTTDANGLYLFDNLVPGSYNLTFLLPTGYSFTLLDQGADNGKDSDVNTATGKTTTITLASGQNDPTWDAGMYKLASLGDYVWEDLNRNGVQDAGEPGIADVTVTLKNETATLTTTTDAGGLYLFDNLVPGSYNLTFLLPTGYSFTLRDQGADNSKDSDADVASGKTTTITLASGQHDPTWDAGLIRPASLGDFVWEDLNRNGVQDAGEPGIAEVTVTLKNETATLTTTTDANGLYLFDNLVPGSYNLTFLLPTGYSFTLQDQGADNGKDSDVNTATGKTTTITLASGQNDPTWDAGMYKLASLGDYVWEDLNRNGVQDAGEPGIADVTVTLKNETATLTTTTDAVGLYLFDNLVPGSYNLTFLLPTGYSFTLQDQVADNGKDSDADVASGKTTTITLASGQHDPTWDAGLIRPASLGDFVWEDLNRNGVQDAGEPGIADVTVTLKNETATLTTTTDADGLYLFDNLVPGSYNLTFLLPTGYSFTLRDQGADNSKDSDADVASGKTTTITLASGQHDPTWDAGLIRPASLGDFVWEDLNRNGVQDAGEPGIADVTVTLKNETATLTTTTDAGGLYLFDNLVPGSYNLTFLLPTGYSFTLQDQGADNGKDSDADVASGKTAQITLISGQNDPTWDAGMNPKLCLSGYKYNACNGDPLSGWQINVYNAGTHSLEGTATTNDAGYWQVCGLVPGNYWANETLQAGWQNAHPDQLVELGFDNKTVNFWNTPLLCINGYKLNERGDGLSGWTIEVRNSTSDSLMRSIQTDSTGHWEVCDLEPGVYEVSEILQGDYKALTPTNLTVDLTVTSCSNQSDINFTNTLTQCISGRKIDSITGAGLGDWTITATGQDSSNQNIQASNVTNATGYWRICGLLKGNYTVCERLADHPGWTQTYPPTPDGCYHNINVDGINKFTDLDFANDPHGLCISGHKYHNVTGEGLGGWTIHVTNATSTLTTTTNDTGYWQVCQLAAGTYTVCEEPQAGWKNSTPICLSVTLVDVNIYNVDFYNEPFNVVHKVADKTSVQRGEEITYTITVCNYGPTPWRNVNITDVFNYPVEILSPVQTVGTKISWVVNEIPAGTCMDFIVVARVPKVDSKFEMEQSVSGEGFVNVHNDYSTSLQGFALRNCVSVQVDKETYSDCAIVGIGKELGTEIMTKEHGSGQYVTEHELKYNSKNFSIEDKEDVSAVYAPTKFQLPANRSIDYNTLWIKKYKAKNFITGASMNEEYTFATKINRDGSFKVDKNESIMDINSSFVGQAHLGFLKKSELGALAKATPIFEMQEDYTGSFGIQEKVSEYGKNVESNKSATGVGYVAVDKRIRDTQRTYESGSGSYQVEEKIDTPTSYIYKDLLVGSRPSSFSYTPRVKTSQDLLWSEGMLSKSSDTTLRGGALMKGNDSRALAKVNASCPSGSSRDNRTVSYISEKYSGIESMEKTTEARGLNEMSTEATFQGTADYRAIMTGPNKTSEVDNEERYVGSYDVKRHILQTGVSKYDVPHMTVSKDGTTINRWYNGTNATIALYTIHITNDGNRALAPIQVMDRFPPGTEYVYSSIKPSSLGKTRANWTLTHLGIGDNVDIELELNVTESITFGDLVNRVDVYGGYSGGWVNAASYAVIPVNWLGCCSPELAIEKTAIVEPSDQTLIDYRIVLQNLANYPMAVTVVDYLPATLQIVETNQTPAKYGPGRVEWVFNTVPAGDVITIDYVARALRDGQQVNKVKVRGVAITGEGSASAEAEASVIVKGTGSQPYTTRYDGWQPPGWDFNMSEEGWYTGDIGVSAEDEA